MTSLPISMELQIDALLDDLNSSDPEKSLEAARTVYNTVHDPQRLMQIIEHEAARFRQRTFRGTLISLLGVSVSAVAAYLAPDPLAWTGVSFVALVMAGWLSVYIPIRARRSLVNALQKITDPRFIGPALIMLVPDGVTEVKTAITQNRLVRDSIGRALKEMLPLVRAEHRAALTDSQMQTLLVLMKQSQADTPLTVGILRALQQIGDAGVVPAVKAMNRSPHSEIRQAAQETLEYLELREQEKQQARTLLRASDSGQTATPDMLLRPAALSSETNPEQLLRPQA